MLTAMKVSLAGFNIESDLLASLVKNRRVVATPETIAAAYARISRSAKSVDELRQEARRELERARKSNVTIVFGMGHHSVAEHAVFNLDVTGISRLAVEAIEHHRLNAYTERSQRYVKLDEEFVVPEELNDYPDLAREFLGVTKVQHAYYRELFPKLAAYFRTRTPDALQAENWAKEDARYVTNLATATQLGMTANARSLELMVRALASSDVAEVRKLGKELYDQVVAIAPSLILFSEPTDYERGTYPRVREFAQTFMVPAFPRRPRNFIALSASDVALVDYTQNADNKLLAALMHSGSNASYAECMSRTEKQTLARKKEILKLACQDMQAYDTALREFEHLSLTFELVLSASAFAQLKRHRLMTVTCQPYSPNLGWTIPQSVAEVKEHKPFKDVLVRTEETYERIAAVAPPVAQYVLTNSHQRRVLATVDARELYHIARLRQDAAAQWDIRDIACRMVEQARHVMPLTLLLACGKDGYAATYQDLYGRPPAVVKLDLPKPRAIGEPGAPRAKRGRKAGAPKPVPGDAKTEEQEN